VKWVGVLEDEEQRRGRLWRAREVSEENVNTKDSERESRCRFVALPAFSPLCSDQSSLAKVTYPLSATGRT
jgi:hypothetical protein